VPEMADRPCTPWEQVTGNRTAPPPRSRIDSARQYQRVARRVLLGVLLCGRSQPAVLALVPGVMPACIRVKMMLAAGRPCQAGSDRGAPFNACSCS